MKVLTATLKNSMDKPCKVIAKYQLLVETSVEAATWEAPPSSHKNWQIKSLWIITSHLNSFRCSRHSNRRKSRWYLPLNKTISSKSTKTSMNNNKSRWWCNSDRLNDYLLFWLYNSQNDLEWVNRHFFNKNIFNLFLMYTPKLKTYTHSAG